LEVTKGEPSYDDKVMVLHSGPEKECPGVDAVNHAMSVFQDNLQSSKEEKAVLTFPIPLSLGLLKNSNERNNGIQKNPFFQVNLLLIHFCQLCSDLKKQKQKQNTFFLSKNRYCQHYSSGNPVLHIV